MRAEAVSASSQTCLGEEVDVEGRMAGRRHPQHTRAALRSGGSLFTESEIETVSRSSQGGEKAFSGQEMTSQVTGKTLERREIKHKNKLNIKTVRKLHEERPQV